MSKLMGFIFTVSLLTFGVSNSILAASPDWPKSLSMGTASPGGIYYVYGEALAQILTEKLGIPVDPLPTQGSIHNIKLIDNGEAQLGLIVMGVGLQGWNGIGDWTNKKQFRSIRALFPMYDTPLQAVALRGSGITTLAQLDKKRIGIGPRAGSQGIYIPAILKLLGIPVEISFGSYSDMATDMLSKRLDAFVPLAGAPIPSIQEAEAKEPLTFIRLTAEQIDTIRKAMPEFSSSTIPAGTYRSLDKDYATVGVYNFVVAQANLPDELVYQMVKAVFENQPRLLKAHSAASETIPQNVVKNTFLPFHPGAIRYYREIGIKIPEALVPAD